MTLKKWLVVAQNHRRKSKRWDFYPPHFGTNAQGQVEGADSVEFEGAGGRP